MRQEQEARHPLVGRRTNPGPDLAWQVADRHVQRRLCFERIVVKRSRAFQVRPNSQRLGQSIEAFRPLAFLRLQDLFLGPGDKPFALVFHDLMARGELPEVVQDLPPAREEAQIERPVDARTISRRQPVGQAWEVPV